MNKKKNIYKRITDLHVKCKTIKFLENKIGENLYDLGMVIPFQIEHQKHDPWKK